MRLQCARPAGAATVVTALVVAVGVGLRAWVTARGYFYWDDLRLIGMASSRGFDLGFLFGDYDGHFMPGALFTVTAATTVAPLNWGVAVTTMVVLQVLAVAATWRAVRILAPRSALAQPAIMAFVVFGTVFLPASVWWAAALNALPLQAALAWIVGDAVLVCRGEQPRWVVARCTLVLLVGLLFFEKSVVIVPVVMVIAAFSGRWRRARALWITLGVVTVAWLAVVLTRTHGTGDHRVVQAAELMWRSVNSGLVPSIVGGPWSWDRWIPSPPTAIPAVWQQGLGWVVLAAIVGAALWLRPRAVWAVGFAAAYIVVTQLPVLYLRSSPNTALELAQRLIYLPDCGLVLALCAAVVMALPERGATFQKSSVMVRPERGVSVRSQRVLPTVTTAMIAVVAVGAIACSVVSTVRFDTSWRQGPTRDYLRTAQRTLAEHREVPLFDQMLPLQVMLPIAYPDNQLSHIFANVTARPPFGTWSPELLVLNDTGHLVPGAIWALRHTTDSGGSCTQPEVTGHTVRSLDGPLLQFRWYIEVPYCANRDGVVEFSLTGTGSTVVSAQVRAGLHPLYLQIDGAGTGLTINPVTPGLQLHVAAGRVGTAFGPSRQ